jgi:hypothetical protein
LRQRHGRLTGQLGAHELVTGESVRVDQPLDDQPAEHRVAERSHPVGTLRIGVRIDAEHVLRQGPAGVLHRATQPFADLDVVVGLGDQLEGRRQHAAMAREGPHHALVDAGRVCRCGLPRQGGQLSVQQRGPLLQPAEQRLDQ